METKKNIIPITVDIMGPSASGKGTQIKMLIDFLSRHSNSIIYTQTGALIRDFKEGDSYPAKLAKEIYAKNLRQPDYLAIYLWGKDVIEKMVTGNEHLILDGLPRSLPEAQMVKTMIIGHFKRVRPVIIFLNVSNEVALHRMVNIRKRSDDTLEGAKTRLSWFKEDVMPAIDYFRNDPDFHFCEINGEGTEEEVHKKILSVVFGI